jgi:ribosome maturation factor RimP
MEDYRINNETLEESKISSLIELELEELGYLIVQVKINSHERALQIMMERISGELNINDCTNASRVIMPMIESNKLLPDNYRIEISSPGIDRILVRKKDFIQYIGNEIKVELIEKIENKKNYRGEIFGFEEDYLLLTDAKSTDINNKVKIPIQNINKAKLVFSHKLLKL